MLEDDPAQGRRDALYDDLVDTEKPRPSAGDKQVVVGGSAVWLA